MKREITNREAEGLPGIYPLGWWNRFSGGQYKAMVGCASPPTLRVPVTHSNCCFGILAPMYDEQQAVIW